MTYYGLASRAMQEVFEFFATREEAEEAVRTVTRKVPELSADVFLVEVELGDASEN
jgi:uncharacterized protein YfcZ (UPF0381/DUF406 family)